MDANTRKYAENDFAVYKGKKYAASSNLEGMITLLSKDLEDAKSSGFKLLGEPLWDGTVCTLTVTPFDVEEYYTEKYDASWHGKVVCIWNGNDDQCTVLPSSDFTRSELEEYGFDFKIPGEYICHCKTSELKDLHPLRTDFLKRERKFYRELHKKSS